MSAFKCKMCGGTLKINEHEGIAECEYCGTRQTLPKLGDEQKANLYERANHLRRNNEYDKAMSIYEEILNRDSTDAESYWSLVLCRYGIEYVEDPATHKRVPTVNRAQFTSIFADEDYKSAIEHANGAQREIYEHEAKAIDEIQKGILAISRREEPFDVFICYKETDANGRRTPDSVLATDLYHQLKQEGFKVFFSRITLEDKLGVEYEPYIFAALNSAKVMVVLGTKPEYFNAVWVKNEWSRYLALIKNDAKKMLIPAYRDMDPYNLPEEFSHLQAQDMSKLGFMQDLIRGIKKIVSAETVMPPVKETIVSGRAAGANVAPLLRRAFIFLEDGEFANADEYCEKVLDNDPECAEAYLGKMMAELMVRNREDLAFLDEPFDENGNYKRALRYADAAFAAELRGYVSTINERKENRRLESLYKNCVRVMETSKTEDDYINAAKNFEELGSFSNSMEMANRCIEKANEVKIARLDAIYADCAAKMNSAKTEADYKKAADFFKNISGYRDADAMAALCLENAEKARMEAIYISAKAKMEENKIKSFEKAIEIFRSISAFGDSENQIYLCQCKIEEIKAKEAEERLEKERKAEQKRIADQKRRETAKRLAKTWAPVVAGVLAFAILLNYVVIPNFDYIKTEINTMVEEAKAEKAAKEAEKAKEKAEKEAAKAEKDNLEDVSTEDEDEAKGEPNETTPIFKVEVGDIVTFGSYEQDNNLENGAEPIEWQVLDIESGRALVISNYALDCKPYNTSNTDVTWETCSLREWLNNDFINTAFSADEKSMIPTVTVSADKNPKYSTDPDNTTQDQVFLLSINEANQYFSSDSVRQCNPTDYAVANGAYANRDNGNCMWWLRSPGYSQMSYAAYSQNNAAYVFITGIVNNVGYLSNTDKLAVRPAMWIEISDFEKTLPIYEVEVGDIITFGSYEQDNNLENGAEPIEWQVLDIESGRMLVISKYALDCQPYNTSFVDVTWETCSLREWLNNDFINTVFSADEKSMIPTVTVSANKNPDYDTNPGNATQDQVFLLSIAETKQYFDSDSVKWCKPTDYAVANGAYVSSDNGDCWWWLRSPGFDQNSATSVYSGGNIGGRGCNVNRDNRAVRPAMWVEISDFEKPVPIYEAEVGDIVAFGSYEQDNNLENGAEPIKWQVLDIESGRALVISNYALDYKPYNTSNIDVTWETCSLREWLNNDFINTAFSADEKSMIPTVTVSADKNPKYSTDPGNTTQDQVFLLSINEANQYFSSDSARWCIPTDLVAANERYVTNNTGNCMWWLRTQGDSRNNAAYVFGTGNLNNRGHSNTDKLAVRPAMWIEISDEG